MQIKIISVPVLGGEAINEELNAFLRSKKIIQVEQQLVPEPGGAVWSFSIRYTEDHSPLNKSKEKVDYREVLSEAAFQRFVVMRAIRKRLATEAGLPAYAVFTDEELAEMAQVEVLTFAEMKKIKGVGISGPPGRKSGRIVPTNRTRPGGSRRLSLFQSV